MTTGSFLALIVGVSLIVIALWGLAQQIRDQHDRLKIFNLLCDEPGWHDRFEIVQRTQVRSISAIRQLAALERAGHVSKRSSTFPSRTVAVTQYRINYEYVGQRQLQVDTKTPQFLQHSGAPVDMYRGAR